MFKTNNMSKYEILFFSLKNTDFEKNHKNRVNFKNFII